MKVLFLSHNLGKTRHFEGVLQELTARGHSVVVTAAHKRNKPLKLGGDFKNNPLIDVVTNPVRRVDEWETFVRPLRLARDYIRFLHPDYVHATKLAERARAYAPDGWPARMELALESLFSFTSRDVLTPCRFAICDRVSPRRTVIDFDRAVL